MRHLYGIGLALAAIWASMAPGASAQDQATDLTHLSIEELMELEVIPIDVLGTHIHVAGEWMVGYRYMFMRMDAHGSQEGDTQDFMVMPASMDMEMHMVKVMYGVTDRLTLMTMLPYRRLAMDLRTRRGEPFSTSSEGIGDLQVMAHYALYKRNADYLIAGVALDVPTGSIDARDDTPAGADQRLPYPMQLGAGTYGLMTKLTYIDQRNNWAWGAHAEGTVRLGTNDHAYRRGNEYHVGLWATRRLTGWMAPFLHVDMHAEHDVVGADPALNPDMVPTADPDRQGNMHLSLKPGLSFYIPEGLLEDQRFAIEAPLPVYDKHDHAMPELGWQISTVWQWTF